MMRIWAWAEGAYHLSLAATTDSPASSVGHAAETPQENFKKCTRTGGENLGKRREWRGQRRRVSCAGRRNRPGWMRVYTIGTTKSGTRDRHHCLLISGFWVRVPVGPPGRNLAL